jgi:hypothetical protein
MTDDPRPRAHRRKVLECKVGEKEGPSPKVSEVTLAMKLVGGGASSSLGAQGLRESVAESPLGP